MTIIEDTRNPVDKHRNVHEQLTAMGHRIVRSKLYVGDYALVSSQAVCVDTKKDLQEVAGNLCQQHERFRAECVRAQEAGIRLVILVEHGGGIDSVEAVRRWVNPRLRHSPHAATGARMAAVMECMTKRYGVEWAFCRKQDTGRRIIEILGGEAT